MKSPLQNCIGSGIMSESNIPFLVAVCQSAAVFLSLWCLTLPTRAAENSLELSAKISLRFDSDPRPIRAVFDGERSLTIEDQVRMQEKQEIALKFDIADPREARLNITVTWPDAAFDTFSFSFVPSHLENDIDVFFFGDGTSKIVTQPFNDGNLSTLSKTACDLIPADRAHLMHQYRVCFALFKAFESNDRKHFRAAFRALKGAFNAYYKLIAERDFGLARDGDLENTSMNYEAEAGANRTIRNNFEYFGVNPGYFKGMVDNIGTSMTNRFGQLRKDVQKEAIVQVAQTAEQLKIEAELLKKRFEAEQMRLKEKDGKIRTVINGIGQGHFSAIEKSIMDLKAF